MDKNFISIQNVSRDMVARRCQIDYEISLQLVYPSKLTIRTFSTQGTVSSLRKRTDPLYFDTLALSAVYKYMPSQFEHSPGYPTCKEVTEFKWEKTPLRCNDLRNVFDYLQLIMDFEEQNMYSGNASKMGPFSTAFLPNMTVTRSTLVHEFSCKDRGNVFQVRFYITAGIETPHDTDGSRREYLLRSSDKLKVW